MHEQLSFDDLLSHSDLSPPSPPPAPPAKSKGGGDRDFLIGATLLMHQWKISPQTRNLALGILNNGAQTPDRNDKSAL